jgi:hypothetical protein
MLFVKDLLLRKLARWSFCIALLLFFILPAIVQAQFNYVTNSDGASVTITGYTGPGGSVVIPDTINCYPVTSIGDEAFYDYTPLTDVIIPNSVNSIGDKAFAICTALTSVAIPNTVTNIGYQEFASCISLTNVTIPGSVISIGDEAFQSCYGLTSVVISNGITTIGYGVFASCSGLTSIAIPNSVTSIGQEAFYQCNNLADVTIPNSVTDIGQQAFADCSLTNITIPNSVTNIGDYAFSECVNLISAYFTGNAPADLGEAFFYDPVTVYYLPGTSGWSASFGGAPTMEGTPPNQFIWVTNIDAASITITGYNGPGGVVAIPDTINGLAVTSVGDSAFDECFGLTSIIIPDGVKSIEFSAFASCTSLTNVALPETMVDLGDESFIACLSLTSFTIPNSVTSIGNSAFGSCTGLRSIAIPNSVTNIGVDAFLFCTNMTNIVVDADNPDFSSLNGVLFDKTKDTLLQYPLGLTNSDYAIPNGVVTIAANAFFYCQNLISANIPGSVTNILGPPFYDCTNLTTISVDPTNPAYTISNSVLFNKAQDTLIQYSPSLPNASYVIPNSVTTIQGDAFAFCANLVNISIPDGVTNIGWGEFFGCSSLASIVIPNGVTSIPDSAFYGCTSLTSIVIPNSVTSIGLWAFQNCSSLTTITIPASVTSMRQLTFLYCGSLTSAYFEGDAPAGGGGAFAETQATVYYLPGTSGWGATYGNVPTQLWYQPQPNVLSFEPSFGLQNNQFGFTVSWATNTSVIVQACTNLANPSWIPIATNSLSSGTNYFCDPQWMNYPNRFYRVTGP